VLKLVVAVVAGITAACGGPGAVGAAPTPVPVRRVEGLQQVRAGEVAAMRRLISDANAWSQFWNMYAAPPVPTVDFTNESVAVVFLGERPNPGYTVRIAGAEHDGPNVRICVEERGPEPEKGYAAVVVYPFDIVAVRARGAAVFVSCG
jgi:hypothetical protein